MGGWCLLSILYKEVIRTAYCAVATNKTPVAQQGGGGGGGERTCYTVYTN